MRPGSKHALLIAAILVLVGLLYYPSVGAYYCGYDDFLELNRLETAACQSAISDFTTPLYGSLKYRPFSLLVNRVTHVAGAAAPLPFRARNFILHLGAVALLYGIAMLLFGSLPVAAAAALLFGVHPLASQAILGAVWTAAFCYTTALLTVFLFLFSLRARHPMRWMIAAMLTAWVALMAYDAELPLFGMTYAYLIIAWLARRRLPVSRAYVIVLSLLTVVLAGSYFVLRALYLPPGVPVPVRLASVVENVVVYASAPLLLIDPVLAHARLGTPLPPDVLRGEIQLLWVAVTVGPLLLLLLAAGYTWRRWWSRLRQVEWPQMAFLTVAAAGAISPFLFFNPHPSETYIYVPVAFFVLAAMRVCYALAGGSSKGLAVCTLLLAAAFIPGTWVRIGRLAECGATARTIVAGLPGAEWREGDWKIRLAAVPGEPQTRRYGFNGYRSIFTIGFADTLQATFQTLYGNRRLAVDLLPPGEFMRQCGGASAPRHACYWIHWDGRVADAAVWKPGFELDR